MWQPDNWGWRARFGIFIVGDDPVPEAEWWAMAPPGVSIHAARIEASGGWAGGSAADGPDGLTLAPDLEHGAALFGRMRLDTVVVGHSSSSFLGGPGWDEAVVERLGRLTNGIPVTTNLLDTLAALQAVAVRRPFLVLPPWYTDRVVEAGLGYLAERGVTTAGHVRFDPGPAYRGLPPSEVYGRGGVWTQDPEALYRQVRRACAAEADGVLIVGTSFRTVAVIEPLEQDLGRPVLAANQVSLWRCLRLASVSAPVRGYGRLFDAPGPELRLQ